MAGAALQVRGLVVNYGRIKAVSGLSLRAEPGELVALVGPNGAGKSSTLGAIVGLVPAAAGEVTLGEERITGMRPEQVVRHGLALSPEGRRVFPSLTVEENLRLGGAALRRRSQLTASRERVLELFPRLAERRRQRAGTLSGGEQQMLAIGRALMSEPRVLLLDEPSLGLAPRVVERIFELIQRLHEDGITVLLVEQNLTTALELADRGYVLSHGAVVAEGRARDLLADADIAQLYLGGGAAQ